jgi:hypothetical protein
MSWFSHEKKEEKSSYYYNIYIYIYIDIYKQTYGGDANHGIFVFSL